MIKSLEVIRIFDAMIEPPKWKMAVCIQPDCLYFLRINSRDTWKPAVKIERFPHHSFLQYDSFLECKRPLQFDEFSVEQGLNQSGIIGNLDVALVPEIFAHLQANTTITKSDLEAIGVAVGAYPRRR